MIQTKFTIVAQFLWQITVLQSVKKLKDDEKGPIYERARRTLEFGQGPP